MPGHPLPALRPDEAGPRRGREGGEGVTTRELFGHGRMAQATQVGDLPA